MKKSLFSRLWLGLLLVMMPACTLVAPGQPPAQTISGVPVVELVSPAPNNTYLEGVAVTIQASVSNAGADIALVEFSVDNTVIATADDPNTADAAVFSISQRWTAEGEGEHTISVTAFRADNSSSAPAAVTVNVITQVADETEAPDDDGGNNAQSGGTTGGQQQATRAPTTAPTAVPTTAVPTTEVPAATVTPNVPTITVNQGIGVNVRSGPSTLFNPPLGQLAGGSTAEIIAINPAGDWYRVRTAQLTGWVFSANVTVSGNTSGLPIEQGPPLPTPVPATPVPPTATPGGGTTGGTGGTGANIIANTPSLSPSPFCGVGYTISVNIVNTGNQPTATGFFVGATVTGPGSQYPIQVSVAVSAIIQPQQNFVAQLPVITPVMQGGQTYTVTITLDPNNQVPETNDSDNTSTTTYVLGGTCT
jgi:hypothetical protein